MDNSSRPKPSVYVETTIVSYLTAEPSSNVIILAQQELTRRWWRGEREKYRSFVSPRVFEEGRRGDPAAAEKRLRALAELESLESNVELGALAEELCEALRIPKRAAMDAYHLAFAVHYELDYLLTWNCTHLANARILRLLADYAVPQRLWLPIICTPAEMVEHTTEK